MRDAAAVAGHVPCFFFGRLLRIRCWILTACVGCGGLVWAAAGTGPTSRGAGAVRGFVRVCVRACGVRGWLCVCERECVCMCVCVWGSFVCVRERVCVYVRGGSWLAVCVYVCAFVRGSRVA